MRKPISRILGKCWDIEDPHRPNWISFLIVLSYLVTTLPVTALNLSEQWLPRNVSQTIWNRRDPSWGSEPFLHPLHEFQVIVVMEGWNTSQHDKEYDLGLMSTWMEWSLKLHTLSYTSWSNFGTHGPTKSAICSVINHLFWGLTILNHTIPYLSRRHEKKSWAVGESWVSRRQQTTRPLSLCKAPSLRLLINNQPCLKSQLLHERCWKMLKNVRNVLKSLYCSSICFKVVWCKVKCLAKKRC